MLLLHSVFVWFMSEGECVFCDSVYQTLLLSVLIKMWKRHTVWLFLIHFMRLTISFCEPEHEDVHVFTLKSDWCFLFNLSSASQCEHFFDMISINRDMLECFHIRKKYWTSYRKVKVMYWNFPSSRVEWIMVFPVLKKNPACKGLSIVRGVSRKEMGKSNKQIPHWTCKPLCSATFHRKRTSQWVSCGNNVWICAWLGRP